MFTNIVNYLTNHDHNHLMVELGDREIFDAEAFKRIAGSRLTVDSSRRTTDLDGRVW